VTLPTAETAYLFRHALVRDAAYELQPPGDRALLHGLALAALEDAFGGTPALETPQWLAEFRPHASDAHAQELSVHARLAADDRDAALLRKSAIYLRRAAHLEFTGYRNASALKLLEELTQHPGADGFLRAEAHHSAGQVHYRHGDVASAEAAYLRTLDGLEPDDEVGRMVAKCSLIIVHSHSDNGPHVAEAHGDAAEYWRNVGHTRREVSSLINFAVWHCEEGDPDIARRALNESVRLAKEHGLRRAEEAAVGTLALLESGLGRHEAAEDGLRRALAIAREMGNLSAELTWMCSLAGHTRDMARLDEAEALYREAAAQAAAHDMDPRRDQAEAQLAGVLALRGQLSEARAMWNAAWSSLCARKDDYARRVTRKSMEDLLKNAGLPPLADDGSFGA
jgi:tetratricopeptide (TPR) repeat protein